MAKNARREEKGEEMVCTQECNVQHLSAVLSSVTSISLDV